MASREDRIRRAYDFLTERATQGAPFSLDEFVSASGWRDSTAKIYISKKLHGFVSRLPGGLYEIEQAWLDLPYDAFLDVFAQKRSALLSMPGQQYDLLVDERVILYDFFMPMTNERTLRKALEGLFFLDSVRAILEGIGVDAIQAQFDQGVSLDEAALMAEVCDLVGRLFAGYSVSHVSGRFRGSDVLQPRAQALAEDEYIIDETTAVVRFIIPCSDVPDEPPDPPAQPTAAGGPVRIQPGIDQIGWLFERVFAVPILKAVEEQEVWLLESGLRTRLFRWKRASEGG